MFEREMIIFFANLTGKGDTCYWLSMGYFQFGKVTMHNDEC